MVVRNYGAICVGETIEETTYLAHLLVTACNQQVLYSLANNCGVEKSSWWLFECHYSTLLLSTPVRLSLIETFRFKDKDKLTESFFLFLHILKKYTPRKASFYFFCLFCFCFVFPNRKRPKGKKPRKEGS